MQPELSEEDLDLLLTTFAKNGHEVVPMQSSLDQITVQTKRLVDLGFLEVNMSPPIEGIPHVLYINSITSEGRVYIIQHTDPTLIARRFIDLRFINYAIYWIERFVPVECLPEFFVHTEPDIRRAASEKYTGECSDLVFPLDTYRDPRHRACSI